MQLLDHVSITVRDLEAAKPFYKAVMEALGAVVAYERPGAIGSVQSRSYGRRPCCGSQETGGVRGRAEDAYADRRGN